MKYVVKIGDEYIYAIRLANGLYGKKNTVFDVCSNEEGALKFKHKYMAQAFARLMKGEELHTRGRTSAMHDKKGKILGFVSTPNTYGEYHFGLKDYGKTWALTKEELK